MDVVDLSQTSADGVDAWQRANEARKVAEEDAYWSRSDALHRATAVLAGAGVYLDLVHGGWDVLMAIINMHPDHRAKVLDLLERGSVR